MYALLVSFIFTNYSNVFYNNAKDYTTLQVYVLTNIVGNNITNSTIKQIVTTKLPPPLLERYISFKKHLVFAIQVDVHKYQPLHIYARVIWNHKSRIVIPHAYEEMKKWMRTRLIRNNKKCAVQLSGHRHILYLKALISERKSL